MTAMLGRLTCAERNGYVEFETDRLGTFIVCIPGVAFVMPMWGYAAIAAAAVVFLATGICSLAVWKRNRRRLTDR